MKICGLLVILSVGVALGQTPVSKVDFEVASVRPAAPTTGHFQYHMTMRIDGGRAVMSNASLVDLIGTAYRVKAFEISGPSWMSTEKFDIIAKLPDGSTAEQVPEMLQSLLAERFKLTIHRAPKDLPGLALVVGKKGPKLKVSPPEEASASSGWSRSFGQDGTMHIDARNLTMPALADLVARFLDYPVKDMSEIKGSYDMGLDFSSEDLRTGSRTSGVLAAGPAGDSDSSTSLVFASLEKLGLKLERRRLAIDAIVVDQLERAPTAN